ncbi:MAG TPA: YihY/virulence factor BrkB family protein [Verrucomicrobiae bacterium]|nr:YihY/virulence factor BrkB family protein [Verrucomicrobiae bacterium]
MKPPYIKCFFRGLGRLFPNCVLVGEAIAFNMFLAFFPILLLAIGILSATDFFLPAIREFSERLRQILPPGSEDVVMSYFVRRGVHTGRWLTLGLGGTLIAGSQVMVGFIEGFRIIEDDPIVPRYLARNGRALALLVLTILPTLAVVIFTVFGRQARAWLIRQIGLPFLVRELWFFLYAVMVFTLAMLVLVLLYRIGRPGRRGFRRLIPGAIVATVLWWVADISFGFYVRRMPYDVVYGGLAAAIGLILWMYLTAMIILFGAAFNAEYCEFLSSE